MSPIRSLTPFLAARSLPATIDFYTRLLGFRVECLYPQDAPTLAFLEVPPPASTHTPTHTPRLIFDSTLWPGQPAMTGQLLLDLGPKTDGPSRVLEAFDRLRPHAEILWGPEVYPYGRREFSCRDPNGYALVISEQTDEAATCGQ